MKVLFRDSETIECIFIKQEIVESTTERDPMVYFFEVIPTKTIIKWNQTQLLYKANLIKSNEYKISYLVWKNNNSIQIKWPLRIQDSDFAYYIKSGNKIIRENLKTGEIENLSKSVY